MINQNISGIIPAFIFLFLLFLLSACGDDRNQGSVFERGDAGRTDSDSLLFMQYTERLGYHYSVRSDSVLWYIDELIGLAQRNNRQLEVLRFTAGKAFAYLNAGEYARALEYFQQAFEMAQNPKIENHYWTLGQLTAGIAHEIKNPLNFVNNFSEVSLEMISEALEELGKTSQDGPGIPDDLKDKILQPFFTTKKGAQGIGLGAEYYQRHY